MQRFTISFVGVFICANAVGGAYLPVVDVSSGNVSARAIFGEEIVQPQPVAVAPLPKKIEKKVVARNTGAVKKSANTKRTEQKLATDVLKPLRPSSDLWANNDAPLRMPRMDEISVVRSDDLLPEETLDAKPVRVAQLKRPVAVAPGVTHRESVDEINALRNEIARLKERQRQTEQNIAMAQKIEAHVEPRVESRPTATVEPRLVSETRGVNVRREVVPMETKRDVVMRSVASKDSEPKIVSVDRKMSSMSPSELKKAFKKTYLSENKHLSTYQIDERYDVASDMSADIEGFSAQRDLSEMDTGVRPLEIKISFMNNDAGLSRDNYTLLSETASIVVNNPKRAIQVAIPESATHSRDARKLTARRLAIVEQVLRDTGVAEQRIVPVLSQRDDDVFVLRIISGDVFETLTQQKRNVFGDNVSKKTYKSMAW